MDNIRDLTNILRAGRALAGLSQEELGEAAGLSRQIIVRMEKGDGNIPVGAIAATRAALENKGVIFIASAPGRGPGVALHRQGQVFESVKSASTAAMRRKRPEASAAPPAEAQGAVVQAEVPEVIQAESPETQETTDKHGKLWHWWNDR